MNNKIKTQISVNTDGSGDPLHDFIGILETIDRFWD